MMMGMMKSKLMVMVNTRRERQSGEREWQISGGAGRGGGGVC